MKLNGLNIYISKFNSEEVDGEYILFFENSHRIVVLNSIATVIWKLIEDCDESNHDLNYEDIVAFLKSSCCSLPNDEEVLSDVKDAIDQLIQIEAIVIISK